MGGGATLSLANAAGDFPDDWQDCGTDDFEAVEEYGMDIDVNITGVENGGKDIAHNSDEMADEIGIDVSNLEASGILDAPPCQVSSTLFNLIEIKSDKQDLSFVEKVLLSRGEILAFSNSLAPGSIKTTDGRWLLDLSLLDKSSLGTVGFYGSKSVMTDIFTKESALSETEIEKLQMDTLAPGLYGCLGKEKLIVFYWQPSKKLSEARRNDISCNFIRYLMELCDIVYSCVEVEDGSVPISSLASASSKKHRTQRLQISLVKSSENDFKVRPGIKLSLPLRGISPTSQELPFKLSEGFHRSALLVPEKYSPKDSFRRQERKIKADEVPKLVESWGNVSIDCSKLNEAEFILFCKTAMLEGVDDFTARLGSLEEKMAKGGSEFYNIEEYTNKKKEEVLHIFAEGLSAYLRIHYPWEESLYSRHAREDKLNLRKSHLAGTRLLDFLDYSDEVATGHSTDSDEQIVRAMEANIMKVVKGDDHAHRMVFVGSEVCFNAEINGPYVIESSGGRTSGPVMYDDVLKLRAGATAPVLSDSVFTIKLTTEAGAGCPVLVSDDFGWCLLSNFGLFGMKGSTYRRINVKFRSVRPPTECPLEALLDSCARDMVPALEKKAYFGNFMLTNKSELGLQEVDDHFLIQCVLADCLEQSLPSEHVNFCDRKWNEILHADHPLVLDNIEVPVLSSCLDAYKAGRMMLMSKFVDFVEGSLFKSLKWRVRSELEEKRKRLKESIKQDKSRCVAAFSSSLLNKYETAPKVIIERCEACEPGYFQSFFTDKKHVIRFSRQETQNERIRWRAMEFLPMKKELDIQASKSDHLITPQCSELRTVVDIDSTAFKLVKVILLKTGQVLVFVKGLQEPSLAIYLCQTLSSGLKIPERDPIRLMKRGIDLVAFDETSKFIAFYEDSISTIRVFRFDESFREMIWTGIDVVVSDYRGSKNITWIQFVAGKGEILVADETLCVRVFEVAQPAMMKPRTIQLPDSVLQVCTSADGLCLIALCGAEAEPRLDDNPIRVAYFAEVYRLDDSLERINVIELNLPCVSMQQIEVAVVSFGTQMQLLIYDNQQPEILHSLVLDITLASQSCQLQLRNHLKAAEVADVKKKSSCHELDYLYHIFDKYATSPPLLRKSTRNLLFGVVVKVLSREHEGIGDMLINHTKSALDKLRREKGKDFSNLNISFDVHRFGAEELRIQSRQCNMADFLRQLMCLVPVQIARAENNNLRPLIDGLEMSADINYSDAISLAGIVRFGMYDAVLESWGGPVKVISSMGKQSSGKSYLLNHLSGSLLDVAGGRCTDGVWMTTCVADNCLYVILDFEGLGSFERSEQEDMLLSILNAAVSNITIFNKKDFHLDKETEAVFERFQNGVSLVKQDEKLFKGLFYMAIKDVDAADVDDLRDEFYSKILQICNKSQDNFLTKMYGGEVEIAAMPPFNRTEFHDSIFQIAQTVEELEGVHMNGKSFLRDLKLVIAQISSKDWSPIDSKRIAFKVNMLRKHMHSAIAFGSLAGDNKVLVNFDSEEEIEDMALSGNGRCFEVRDTGLQLTRYAEMDVIGTVLELLQVEFVKVVPRNGKGGMHDEEWHMAFENFMGGLVERRKKRVLDWIAVNTAGFSSDGEVQKLVLETTAMIAEVKEQLALCNCKCGRCFLRCILEKSHPSGHSCNGNHRCLEVCTYCQEEGNGVASHCTDVAGHEGPHDCRLKSHTCGQTCDLSKNSSNCNKSCSLKVGHEGEHRCNSRQHMCNMKCSLLSCKNTCVSPVELTNHGRHACYEKMCPMQCSMQGCKRKCAAEDHFHSMQAGVTHHFCGNEHQCRAKCDSVGNCEVITEILMKTRTFVGKRSNFEYDHVSEQNGVRKDCCIPIPPFKSSHAGPHMHTLNPSAVHFCEVRCQGCGYFCNLPIGHMGFHDTTHGNMTDKTFTAESEEVDILDRKYAWGESGVAEMCMMHCKSRGRGHVHLTVCEECSGGVCAKVKLPEGARHQTKRYGPDFDIPKDELTHPAYWKNMRFKDPCSEEDQKQFVLCANACASTDHNSMGGAGNLMRWEVLMHSETPCGHAGNLIQGKSYCTEKLWHEPVPKLVSQAGTGYVTEDGHHFACNHSRDSANHVIFVIDMSSSMGSSDISPRLVKFPRNRLGCVYEAIVRFIRTRLASNLQDTMSVVLFNHSGSIGIEREPMTEAQVDQLLSFHAAGSTTYSAGIGLAEQILVRSLSDASVMSKAPAVIFLSDGGNNGGVDPVYCVTKLKSVEPRLVLHTIMFGSDPSKQILIDMAKAGDGVFQVSLDELQLARSFEGLAKSLIPKVAALI